jgi:hypothetical protein
MGTGVYVDDGDAVALWKKEKKRMGLEGDIPPDVPEAGVWGGDVGATGGAAKQAGDSQPEWRTYYPNVELGPVATGNGSKREFKNSLESEIQTHAQAKKLEQAQMGYGNVPQFGWVDHSTLPGEAARRDMNNEKNWSTHRDETGDAELFSKEGWHKEGLTQWVHSPEFDKNQTDRAKGELAATDSEKFGKQVKSLMFDNAKEARQKDERMSGYYTDPYTGLPMPILNEHSSELDRAGATFRDFILKRNPGVRTWSAMKDLSRYEYTEDPRDLESFYQKWAENAMDAATLEAFVPEGVGAGVGVMPPRAPGGPGVVRGMSGAARRELLELVERMKLKGQLGSGLDEYLVGADAMTARLKASAKMKERLTYDNISQMADSLGYKSAANEQHYWSGGKVARTRAEEAARERMGTTLEMTPGGKFLDELNLFSKGDSPLAEGEPIKLFREKSLKYVNEGQGPAYAHLKKPINPHALWFDEMGQLVKNKRPIFKDIIE